MTRYDYMKILCVVPSYYPAFKYGGPIFSVHGLNKTLVKKGIDITVYTTNVGLSGRVPVNSEVDVEGVKVFYFAFTKFFEFFGETGWQFSMPMTMALKKNLKMFDVVYIVAIWNYPIATAAYYCRKYKKPYIISPRGLLYPYAARKKIWKKVIYYNLISKRDIEGANTIHYTTRDEAEKCHPFLRLKNHAVVIPNGIDTAEFNNLPPAKNLRNRYPFLKGKKVILFLGRINWKKGLDILIKAYSILLKKRADIHLLIAGGDEGGYKKKVEEWIKDYKIAETVTFTGMLTGKEKVEAYAGSYIFILPSYSENFGMSIVEAMACKLPVVITNRIGLYPEVAEYKAGIVTDCDPDQIAEAMTNLLEDGELRRRMGENGRKLIDDKFSLDKAADEMIGLCENIIY